MSFARDVYTASASQTDFTITFAYRDNDDIVVSQNGTTLTEVTDYTFPNATTMRLNSGATSGDTIVLQRATSQDTLLIDFTAGTLTSDDLDDNAEQLFYMAQEAIDIANTALGLGSDNNWDATTKLIKNVTDPTDAQDAATKNYVDGVALGSFPSPLAIASGGTGGATAAAARTSLGLAIDTDVQSHVMTTQGDMVRGGASGAPERFAIGAAGSFLGSDGTDATWDAPTFAESSTVTLPFPHGYVSGLKVTRNSSDTSNDLDIAAGVCRDDTDTINMVLTSALTKQIDAAWAVGTNAGGIDTGSVSGAQRWYIWLIMRSDTGVVDVLFSLSRTSPTMPTNYDYKRRIGGFSTSSSAIYAQGGPNDTERWFLSPATGGTTLLNETDLFPSGCKAFNLVWNGVSLTGTDAMLLRLGPASGVVSTGYVSSSHMHDNAGGGSGTSNTTGFVIRAWDGAAVMTGVMPFQRLAEIGTTHYWVMSGVLKNNTVRMDFHGGIVNFTGELADISLVSGGANTFDGGNFCIEFPGIKFGDL